MTYETFTNTDGDMVHYEILDSRGACIAYSLDKEIADKISAALNAFDATTGEQENDSDTPVQA